MSVFDEIAKIQNKQQQRSGGSTQNTAKSYAHLEKAAPGVYAEIQKILSKQQEHEDQAKKKKKREEETLLKDDIAPVMETTEPKARWFQKGAFSDGWQFGDLSKTILGTTQDIIENTTEAAVDATESLIDTHAYALGAMGILNKDKTGQFIAKELLQPNLPDRKMNTGEVISIFASPVGLLNYAVNAGDTEANSVLGQKGDSMVQSASHMAGSQLLQKLGVPAWLTMGVNSFGGELENAFRNDATYTQAGVSAGISAVAEAITEKLSGVIKFKGAAADEGLQTLLKTGVKNGIVRTLLKLGVDLGGEGLEEVASEELSALGKKLTYMKDKEWKEIISSEDRWDAFWGGVVMAGGMSGVNAVQSAVNGVDYTTGLTKNEEAVVNKLYNDEVAKRKSDGSLKLGDRTKIYNDLVTKMKKGYIDTDAIEEVLGGESYKEYKNVADNETNLKKKVDELVAESDKLEDIPTNQLTGKQQLRRDELRSIIPELQNQIRNNENSTNKKDLKSKLENEVMNMVRGDRLSESYAEKARAYQKLDIDTETFSKAKHADAAKQTVASAVELGANNTNRVRDLVEHAAQISGKTGKAFLFKDGETIKNDFIERHTKSIEKYEQMTNRTPEQNKALAEMKQLVEDVKSGKKVVNGENTADGIVLNIDSKNPLMVTVGHEVTHDTENSKSYDKMKKALFAYASTKGIDVQTRIAMAKMVYEGTENANAEQEVVADLVGEMLFTDDAFVDHLARTDTNVFQNLWNDIKNLVKMATPGSKEAKELANLEHKFEKAFREANKAQKNTANSGVKYSLNSNAKTELHKALYDKNYEGEVLLRDETPAIMTSQNGVKNLPMAMNASHIRENVFTEEEAKKLGLKVDEDSHYHGLGEEFYLKVIDGLDDVKEAYRGTRYAEKAGRRENYFLLVSQFSDQGGNIVNVPVYINEHAQYNRVFVDVNKISTVYGKDNFREYIKREIQKKNLVRIKNRSTQASEHNAPIALRYGEDASSAVIVEEENGIVKKQFSLSDSNGRQLSEGQNEFFKNSKVRDEDGNLKVMYHGTPNGDFTVFKDGTYFTDNKEYADRYQNPSASSISAGKTASNPKTFEVYLDIKKPFDLSDAEARRIYIEDYIKGGNAIGINPYLSDAEYAKINTIDWTEGEDLRDFLIENGYDYDGLVLDEGADGGYGEDVKSRGKSYVVFSPEQVKSVSNENPTSDPDIRYSLTDTQASDAQPVGTGLTGRDILTKQAPVQTPASYDVMGATPETNIESRIRPNVVEEEAPIAPMPVETAPVAPMDDIAPIAENATTEDIAPMPAVDTRREVYAEPDDIAPVDGKRRKWIGTSTESEVVDGQILPDDLDQELIHYQPISNKKTLGNANSMLDSMGYESSVSYMNQRFASSKVSLDDIALGERLIQEAVKRGDTETAKDLIMDISILGTELGQKVQALSIIKRLTPEGQLKMLMRTVERGKAKNDKAFEGVEVTNEMAKEIIDTRNADGTYDQDKLNAAVENVKQKIAKEMKATILERINEWRYLSMLGNPKTHIRNLVSNVAMYGTRQFKNAIARTGETLAGNKIERTKTWQRASKEVRDFAKQVASQEYGTDKTSKYSEAGDLKSRRQVLKIKALDVASKANSAALSAEDTWFSKPAYRQALQEYLTANGIRTEEDIQKNGKLIAEAKQYAKLQAQEATFQQDSYIASKISEIERKNPLLNVAVGSIMPFKKTPINIAKTGLAYSPLGFARNVYDAIKVSKGEMNASTAIDHFAQTLTGTSLALIGYALASRGALNGAGKDDKEGKYDYQLGKQSYSFNFDGDSFSLSWLSPVAMPLFVGANAYEILVEDKDWDYNVVGEALAQTLDPMNEMSFLSSLTDVLSSYDSGMAAFGGMLESAGQSYITSFVPTLFSQIAQVTDDKKRSTKIDANSGQDFLDETWNQIKYKIPGLRQTLEPSTDVWGNEIPLSENAVTKALETFILPYSRKDNIATKVDEEIKEVYRLTGENGVIPNVPYNYINYKNEKYEMTAAEHTEFKKVYGQTAYNLMEDLIYTDTYRRASAEDKAKMMDDIFTYAMDEAKREFFDGRDVEYANTTEDNVPVYKENAIKGAIDNDMTVEEFKLYRDNPEKAEVARAIGGFDVYSKYHKDTAGMSLSEKADYVGKMKGLSVKQKNLLINSESDRKEPIDLTGYEKFANFEQFEYAKKNPTQYAVSKAISKDFSKFYGIHNEVERIKAENDSSSGTKDKDVVKQYIFSLDLDEGQKALLYRSLYSSKSDKSKYNRQIVEYLDNRDDISWAEMKEILIALDFTITDGNRIKW